MLNHPVVSLPRSLQAHPIFFLHVLALRPYVGSSTNG